MQLAGAVNPKQWWKGEVAREAFTRRPVAARRKTDLICKPRAVLNPDQGCDLVFREGGFQLKRALWEGRQGRAGVDLMIMDLRIKDGAKVYSILMNGTVLCS